MKALYSIDDLREATGLGRTKLYQLINSGEIKAIKVGKRTVVRQAALEEFLENCQDYVPQNKTAVQ